jgi:prepilin-type N-terminal cleavage/methylation domain-containing protein
MHKRNGFTLIELLVVIAIIVLLMALLLPAIQKVREAANKMTCANNLKQIAIAFHHFHNDYSFLPTAGNYDSGNPPTNRLDWGWAYEILPYMELDNVRKITSNTTIRQVVVKGYYCPSRRSPALYGNWAKSDYAGNGGSRIGSDGYDGLVGQCNGSSVFNGAGGKIALTAGIIPDGTSNTLMVAEKWLNFGTMGGGGSANDWSDNESWAGPGYADADIMRGCVRTGTIWRTPLRDINVPTPPDTVMEWRFGSSHPAGINAAFGDGSVRTVRYAVNDVVFMRACLRNDGQAYDLNDL